MKDTLRYGRYFLAEGIRHVTKKPKKVIYDNVTYLDDLHSNRWLAEKIRSGEPFMAGRFGSGEMRAFRRTLEVRFGLKKEIPEETLDSLCINAGFFPRDRKKIMEFGALMEKSCKEVDLIATWQGLVMEDYIYDTFLPDATQCFLSGLEPFFVKEPWTAALEGKRVLVIHPFEETIRSQYEKRTQLFLQNDETEQNILPEFTLLTVKAVQSIGGQGAAGYRDWFQALDDMTEKAFNQEFDVAIIGCGAYGFPLAARLKAAGKQVVHMGGASQLLFGIRGKRWEDREDYRSIMNDAWVHPSESEKPESASKIENSCYW
jgi:hypothetical protein